MKEYVLSESMTKNTIKLTGRANYIKWLEQFQFTCEMLGIWKLIDPTNQDPSQPTVKFVGEEEIEDSYAIWKGIYCNQLKEIYNRKHTEWVEKGEEGEEPTLEMPTERQLKMEYARYLRMFEESCEREEIERARIWTAYEWIVRTTAAGMLDTYRSECVLLGDVSLRALVAVIHRDNAPRYKNYEISGKQNI